MNSKRRDKKVNKPESAKNLHEDQKDKSQVGQSHEHQVKGAAQEQKIKVNERPIVEKELTGGQEDDSLQKEKSELEKEKLLLEIRNLKKQTKFEFWKLIPPTMSFIVVLISAILAYNSDLFKSEITHLEKIKTELRDTIIIYKEQIKSYDKKMKQFDEYLFQNSNLFTQVNNLKKDSSKKSAIIQSLSKQIKNNDFSLEVYEKGVEDMLRDYITKPLLRTLTPSNITRTSAKFRGKIIPGDFITSAWFEFNANNVATTNSLFGSSPKDLEYTITGLRPNTEYVYRISAVNNNGPVMGKPIKFRTLP